MRPELVTQTYHILVEHVPWTDGLNETTLSAVDKAKTDIAKAFGNALREARQKAAMSQEGLALQSGIDRTFVSMLERGVRQPALSSVVALSTALKVAPGALVDRAMRLLSTQRAPR